MTHDTPTDVLEREHRCIEKVVAAASHLADALDARRPEPTDSLRDIVEFMRHYADRCHHGKEEAILFPLLVRKGVPVTGCPIGALTAEHEQGRSVVNALAAAVADQASAAPGAESRVAASLRDIAALYPGHIWKEDFLLFPMTQKVLGPADQLALAAEFARADEAFGAGEITRLERAADEIAALAAGLAGEAG